MRIKSFLLQWSWTSLWEEKNSDPWLQREKVEASGWTEWETLKVGSSKLCADKNFEMLNRFSLISTDLFKRPRHQTSRCHAQTTHKPSLWKYPKYLFPSGVHSWCFTQACVPHCLQAMQTRKQIIFLFTHVTRLTESIHSYKGYSCMKPAADLIPNRQWLSTHPLQFC